MKLSKEFKIGISAIATLVLLFFGINFLKGVHSFKQGNFYYLICDKVEGLAVSSHVKLHGLKVGMVRSLEYDDRNDQVIVYINLYDSDLKVPRDSRVFIQPDLLGTSNVVLEFGKSNEYFNPWDTIYAPPTEPALLDKAAPILSQFETLMPKIDSLISGINVLVNESKLHESLLEINTMTTHLNQSVNQLNHLLRKDVPSVLGNVQSATANLDTISTQLKEAEIQQLFTSVNATIQEANRLLEKAQSNESSVGQLLNNTQLHDQLNRTVADVDSLINDIKANPKRYIHIKVF